LQASFSHMFQQGFPGQFFAAGPIPGPHGGTMGGSIDHLMYPQPGTMHPVDIASQHRMPHAGNQLGMPMSSNQQHGSNQQGGPPQINQRQGNIHHQQSPPGQPHIIQSVGGMQPLMGMPGGTTQGANQMARHGMMQQPYHHGPVMQQNMQHTQNYSGIPNQQFVGQYPNFHGYPPPHGNFSGGPVRHQMQHPAVQGSSGGGQTGGGPQQQHSPAPTPNQMLQPSQSHPPPHHANSLHHQHGGGGGTQGRSKFFDK